jgi:hypothetical protein
MNPLIAKLRKAREKNVEAGGFIFTIRRPTDVEAMQMGGFKDPSMLIPYVIGWDKVREIDVVPGGDAHPLPFDADVCREWLCDQPDLLAPLVEAITEAYVAHRTELKEQEKN